MVSITYRAADGSAKTVSASIGESVMHAALSNSIDGIVGECGGSAMCATCHVYVHEPFLDHIPGVDDVEHEMLECTASERRACSRLSCQIEVTAALDGLVVDLPEAQT